MDFGLNPVPVGGWGGGVLDPNLECAYISVMPDYSNLYTTLFSILYRRQVVPLRQLPLIQCTLSTSLNYLPPVQY